jgi:hypothetical protein
MQGNPAEIAETREKCGFLAGLGGGAVTLHQEMGGIKWGAGGERVS